MADTLQLYDLNREQAEFARRLRALFSIVVVLVVVLVARMVQLQLLDHDRYATLSEDNRIQIWPVPPTRGLILDRDGELLADNRVVFSLTVVRERVRVLEDTLAQLQTLVQLSDEEIAQFRSRLKRDRRPYESVALRVQVTDEDIAKIAVEEHNLHGVQVEARLVRHYPFKALTAHAVGAVRRISEDDLKSLSDPVEYAGTDYIGKLGVEKAYEGLLHGHVGHQRVEIDARGRVRQVLDESRPTPGQNLRLHLSSRLQIAAETALGDRRGSIVAIEPATGGILALVSKPGYDPNPFVTGISAADYRALNESPDTPLFNRAVRGLYPPGSTFKPFVGLAALSAGVTSWNRRIYDPGYFKLPGSQRLYRDWTWRRGGGGGQGVVMMDKAIYRSSNTYFYTMGYELGVDRLSSFVSQFGFGQVTSVDVADAVSGLLPTREWKKRRKKEAWYPGDSVNYGIGQGFLQVSPMQLAIATSVLANRGRFVRPRMLKEAEGGDTDLEAWPVPVQIPGVAAEDWERMVVAMEEVVHHARGTAFAHIGDNLTYRIAGKSGTAQVVEIAQGRTYDERDIDERHRKHAWFIAFAPADAPEVAVAVLVENGGGGSAVAAPVARSVIDAWLTKQERVARR